MGKEKKDKKEKKEKKEKTEKNEKDDGPSQLTKDEDNSFVETQFAGADVLNDSEGSVSESDVEAGKQRRQKKREKKSRKDKKEKEKVDKGGSAHVDKNAMQGAAEAQRLASAEDSLVSPPPNFMPYWLGWLLRTIPLFDTPGFFCLSLRATMVVVALFNIGLGVMELLLSKETDSPVFHNAALLLGGGGVAGILIHTLGLVAVARPQRWLSLVKAYAVLFLVQQILSACVAETWKLVHDKDKHPMLWKDGTFALLGFLGCICYLGAYVNAVAAGGTGGEGLRPSTLRKLARAQDETTPLRKSKGSKAEV